MSRPGKDTGRLNPNQVRAVLARFTHVDQLLGSIEQVARSESSPFAGKRGDLSPDEERLVLSFVAQARRRMLAALDRLGVPRPEPTVSARWSAQTALSFADIALAELGPGDLKGYGDLDLEAAAELDALVTDLRALLGRGTALLHERDPGALRERVAGVPGAAGDVLREIERISRESGLAEGRPLIEAAAERAVATTFDVGVFGRVSSGKSSLINALIGENLLPVGATPATAVPLRIRQGALAATVHLTDGSAGVIAVADLADYATEERNPENAKGVRAIELQAAGVPAGLCYLDTPGLGSLSRSGPAQAFAWLPRCDLGLVLVAAGSAIGADDLALVIGLSRAGIWCRLLLSKMDLLSAGELQESVAYLRRELDHALGPGHQVTVQPVSSLPAHRQALAALRRETLEPLAVRHASAARDALRARLHRLVAATAAALAGRRESTDERVAQLQRAVASARQEIDRETKRLRVTPQSVWDQAVAAVTAAWTSGQDGAAVLRQTLLNTAGEALLAVREAVDAARRVAGAGADRRRLPPLFDPEFLETLPELKPPAGVKRLLSRAVAARRLEPVAGPVSTALDRYADRLAAWGRGSLDELANGTGDAAAPPAVLPEELARLDRLVDAGPEPV